MLVCEHCKNILTTCYDGLLFKESVEETEYHSGMFKYAIEKMPRIHSEYPEACSLCNCELIGFNYNIKLGISNKTKMLFSDMNRKRCGLKTNTGDFEAE